MARAGIEKADVSETIMGQILSAVGQGKTRPVRLTLTLVCRRRKAPHGGSTALWVGAAGGGYWGPACDVGDADIVVAGGQENMSLAPHVAMLRTGARMGNVAFVDSMIMDGLTDAFHDYHMGTTAENVATKWQISRDDKDEFAVASQNKAEVAQKAGKFADEITPVLVKTRRDEITVDADEYIKHGVDIAALQKLRPAFSKDGSVTAGNASGINDGAAAVLMSEATATAKNIQPMARIVSYATAVDPAIMGSVRLPHRAKLWQELAGRSMILTLSKRMRPLPHRRSLSIATWDGTLPK